MAVTGSKFKRQPFKHRQNKKIPIPSFIAIGVAAVLLTILGHDFLFPEGSVRSSGRGKILPRRFHERSVVESSENEDLFASGVVAKLDRTENKKKGTVSFRPIEAKGDANEDLEGEETKDLNDSEISNADSNDNKDEREPETVVESEEGKESTENDSETEIIATDVGSDQKDQSETTVKNEESETDNSDLNSSNLGNNAEDLEDSENVKKDEEISKEDSVIQENVESGTDSKLDEDHQRELVGEDTETEEITNGGKEEAEWGKNEVSDEKVVEKKEEDVEKTEEMPVDEGTEKKDLGNRGALAELLENVRNHRDGTENEGQIVENDGLNKADIREGHEGKLTDDEQNEDEKEKKVEEGDSERGKIRGTTLETEEENPKDNSLKNEENFDISGSVKAEIREEQDQQSTETESGQDSAEKDEFPSKSKGREEAEVGANDDYYGEKKKTVKISEGRKNPETEEEVEENESVHEEESHGGTLKLEDRKDIEKAHANVEDGEKLPEGERLRGSNRVQGSETLKEDQEYSEEDQGEKPMKRGEKKGNEVDSDSHSAISEKEAYENQGILKEREAAKRVDLERGKELTLEGKEGEEKSGKDLIKSEENSESTNEEIKKEEETESYEPKETEEKQILGGKEGKTEGEYSEDSQKGEETKVDRKEDSLEIEESDSEKENFNNIEENTKVQSTSEGGNSKISMKFKGTKEESGSESADEEAKSFLENAKLSQDVEQKSPKIEVVDIKLTKGDEETSNFDKTAKFRETAGEEEENNREISISEDLSTEIKVQKQDPGHFNVPALVGDDLLGDPKESTPIQVEVNEVPAIKVDKEKTHKKPPKKKSKKERAVCDIDFIHVVKGLVGPPFPPKFANFTTFYVQEERISRNDTFWKPRFGGHQSLKQREFSFRAREARIHCGFVKPPPGFKNGSGFEIEEEDQKFLEECSLVVASAIFGDWDHLRAPLKNRMSSWTKKTVCFVMFLDEASYRGLSEDGYVPDGDNKVGLWKLVVVRGMPYSDSRKTGKIPKLILHRLFPNAKYSIWVDSKLRLQADPLMIWEKYLWRDNSEYAISQHYDRSCVWEEVERNKELNKYNHTVIDEQFEFYKKDGLTKFDPDDPKKLLPSNVPEGSFIVRAHSPMANLFSCLWFNEVDRFTSRDQLSFFYVYQKLTKLNRHPFYLSMFPDCERRSMLKLFKHKSEETIVPKDTRRPEEVERDRIRSEEEITRIASEATVYSD